MLITHLSVHYLDTARSRSGEVRTVNPLTVSTLSGMKSTWVACGGGVDDGALGIYIALFWGALFFPTPPSHTPRW